MAIFRFDQESSPALQLSSDVGQKNWVLMLTQVVTGCFENRNNLPIINRGVAVQVQRRARGLMVCAHLRFQPCGYLAA